MTLTSKKRVFFFCGIIVLVVIIASATFGAFRYSSVCTTCGAIQNTTEWQIPLTTIGIFHHSSQRPTSVSTTLLRSGVVGMHEHQWLFSQGGGNGVRCAIGGGRHIAPVVQSGGVAAVIAASQQFGVLQLRDKLLHALFDPRTSEAVRVLGANVPTNGFPNASALHAWVEQEMEIFDEMVATREKR